MHIGPDVSEHNGAIVWTKVRGVLFAICKATEGQDFVDHRFAANWRGIAKLRRRYRIRGRKLKRGAYHFLRPRKGRTGATEAKHFLAVVRKAGLRSIDLLILDVEVTELGPADTREYVRSFIDYVERHAGRRGLAYSYMPFFLEQIGGDGACIRNWKTWVAAYGPEPGGGNIIWRRRMLLWQHTDGIYGPQPHAVAGIGQCDVSRLTHGTTKSFHNYGKKRGR